MSNMHAAIVLVLALLLAGCPDDEVVDPVPPQDASASNEATTTDAPSDVTASTDGAGDASENDAAGE